MRAGQHVGLPYRQGKQWADGAGNWTDCRRRQTHPSETDQADAVTDQHKVVKVRPQRAVQPWQNEKGSAYKRSIEQLDLPLAHGHFFSFFLYMASMRLVTRKPPKMF